MICAQVNFGSVREFICNFNLGSLFNFKSSSTLIMMDYQGFCDDGT